MATLKTLLAEHPEWGDLPIVVYDGGYSGYWYITGDDGHFTPYVDNDPDEKNEENGTEDIVHDPVLVFSGN